MDQLTSFARAQNPIKAERSSIIKACEAKSGEGKLEEAAMNWRRRESGHSELNGREYRRGGPATANGQFDREEDNLRRQKQGGNVNHKERKQKSVGAEATSTGHARMRVPKPSRRREVAAGGGERDVARVEPAILRW